MEKLIMIFHSFIHILTFTDENGAKGKTSNPAAKRKSSDQEMTESSSKKMRQTSIGDYFTHLKTKRVPVFACKQPDCVFKGTYDKLMMHERKIHPKKRSYIKVDPSNILMCELCKEIKPISFHTQLEKLKHLAIDHSEFMSSYCPTCQRYIVGLNANCHEHAYKKHSITNETVGDWDKMKDWKQNEFFPFQDMLKALKNVNAFKIKDVGFCILEKPKNLHSCYLCGNKMKNKEEYDKHTLSCVYKNKHLKQQKMGGKEMEKNGEKNDVSESVPKSIPESASRGNQRDSDSARQRLDESELVPESASPGNQRDRESASQRVDESGSQGVEESGSQGVGESGSQGVRAPGSQGIKRSNQLVYNMKTRKIRKGEGNLITFKSTEINDDLSLMISSLREKIKSCLKDSLSKTGQCKVIPNLIVLFRKDNPIMNTSDLALDKIRHILCKASEINMISILDDFIDEWMAQFEKRIEQFTEEQSGYYVLDLLCLELKIFPFKAFAAGQWSISNKMLQLLGRKWKSKLIIPQNMMDQACVIHAIALQLEMFEREQNMGFIKEKLKKIASDKKQCFDDAFLQNFCKNKFLALKKNVILKKYHFP